MSLNFDQLLKRGASADTKSRKEIERRVYEWAQANDMLFSEDEVRANSYGGKLLGKGSEAHAYLTKDRSKVIKFVKPDFFTDRKDLGGYAEYIDNFNNVFPDTAYKIIGMSKDGRGKILVVTEQPFVDGKQLSANGWEKNNCDDKVRRYFANKGFEDLYGDAIYFGNDDYYVSDIGCGNVVFKNGEPVVIDANVLPMSVIKEQQRIENEKKVAKANREIYYLESEIQNERNVIEYFKEKRNDENKESIDGFIARYEQKIKDLQKIISDKKAELGEGVHYRIGNGNTTSERKSDGRIVPNDVDRNVAKEIENRFESEIAEVKDEVGNNENFDSIVAEEVSEASRQRKSILEDRKKQIENEPGRKKSNTSENSERAGSERDTPNRTEGEMVLNRVDENVRNRIALAAINREIDYRRVRAENLRNTYGMSAGNGIHFEEIEKIYRDSASSYGPELEKLFAKTRDVLKRLGVDFAILDEIDTGKETGPIGYATTRRGIRFSIDGLVQTSSSKEELPVAILHEMIHEGVNGAIHLVKSGKADGVLTPKQIEAVETISEIYDKSLLNEEKFGDGTYGLKSEYEFAAQMADPRQRKVLDLGIMDRVVNFARELARKGDRSLWERVKDAIKKLFEISDKDKMDKAIDDILSDFNETIDDIAMADVEENGWSYYDGNTHYRTDESSQPRQSASEAHISKTIDKVAQQTGGKVKQVHSVEEVDNEQVRKDIEDGKEVTGWYDEKTGEVHLYMPNIHDSYTAEKTVWHETVGHRGMRGLLGDKFHTCLDNVYQHAEFNTRKKIAGLARKNGWDLLCDIFLRNKRCFRF